MMKPSVPVQVATAIAHEERVEPDELDIQLQQYIPMDALQYLADHPNEEWTLEFETPKYGGTLRGDRTVSVDSRVSSPS